MDTKLISKKAGFAAIGLVFLLLPMWGCQKNEVEAQENTVMLSSIPKNSDYASLPWVGTRWKLIGFGDEKAKSIRLAVPFNDNSYTVTFKDNGSISGYTSTNIAGGKYLGEPDSVEITNFGPETYINELEDGDLFIDAMNEAFAIDITDLGLVLRYDKDKFLLFKPAE